MIKADEFINELQQLDISFFTGVPDSLLKGFLTALSNSPVQHYSAVNEGAALATATGYHLATGKVPLVYLQNSGIGNIINPLTSIADRDVYSIPMLLLIGWRGKPGVKDEPQHKTMGRIMQDLLRVLEVPVYTIAADTKDWADILQEAFETCWSGKRPIALVVEPDVFDNAALVITNEYPLNSYQVVEALCTTIDPQAIVVCTTGKIGRCFYAINKELNYRILNYFLNVGGMGHACSIALGLAMHTSRRVYLVDGDGALLMHMGALASCGVSSLENLCYIVLNNGAHESVGCQSTIGFEVDFCKIAAGCQFHITTLIQDQQQLYNWLLLKDKGSQFVEIRINTIVPGDLPRPSLSPVASKEQFMHLLQETKLK